MKMEYLPAIAAVISVVMGLVTGILIPVVRDQGARITRQDKEIADLRLHVRETYVASPQLEKLDKKFDDMAREFRDLYKLVVDIGAAANHQK